MGICKAWLVARIAGCRTFRGITRHFTEWKKMKVLSCVHSWEQWRSQAFRSGKPGIWCSISPVSVAEIFPYGFVYHRIPLNPVLGHHVIPSWRSTTFSDTLISTIYVLNLGRLSYFTNLKQSYLGRICPHQIHIFHGKITHRNWWLPSLKQLRWSYTLATHSTPRAEETAGFSSTSDSWKIGQPNKPIKIGFEEIERMNNYEFNPI